MEKNIQNIVLTDALGDDYIILKDMMRNEEVFKYRLDRLLSSKVSLLILADGEVAGFVNLVREKDDDNFLFLDMVIEKEFRGLGIGMTVFQKLQQSNINYMMIAETKKDNIGANITATRACIRIATFEDRNIYLVQKNRYDEFMNENYMSKLEEHYNTDDKILKKVCWK